MVMIPIKVVTATTLLIGGAGSDNLNGNDGIDTVDYSASTLGVEVVLNDSAAGSATEGDAENDTLSNMRISLEQITADILTKDMNVNQLDGGSGNDTLRGNGSADTLNGGAGSNTIITRAPIATQLMAVLILIW